MAQEHRQARQPDTKSETASAVRGTLGGIAGKAAAARSTEAFAATAMVDASRNPSSPPDSLDAVHQTLIDDLNGASDSDFDGRCISQQHLAHSEAITLFKTYLEHGEDAAVRKLCSIGLPVLEDAVRLAKTLASR